MAKSEYLQREEAAKKQLGTKGVKKRVKQLPTAARASLREMTGVDVSRKGVSVDPFAVAMALPLGKVAKAAVALKKAGRAAEAAALGSRLAAKAAGQGARTNRGVQLVGETARLKSEPVFKRLDAAQSGEFLGMTSQEITAQLSRNLGRAAGVSMDDIRKLSRATADTTTGFTKFSKSVPKVVRGVGTVNPEGYAALQKLPDFLGKGAKQIARNIKKAPKRGR